mmetsp:Transcript_7557/g.6688  ORF Transcript_7557/g.6688 Transcript_7557/m.6688 type:complete len:111 (+) Transcript_7557:266-598(+)
MCNKLEYRSLTYIMKYDSYYLGQWIKGTNIREGKGLSVGFDGSLHEGSRTKDDVNGKGREIDEDGNWYEGNIREYLKHGYGVLNGYDNNFKYEGMFKNDKYDGEGNYTYK